MSAQEEVTVRVQLRLHSLFVESRAGPIALNSDRELEDETFRMPGWPSRGSEAAKQASKNPISWAEESSAVVTVDLKFPKAEVQEVMADLKAREASFCFRAEIVESNLLDG